MLYKNNPEMWRAGKLNSEYFIVIGVNCLAREQDLKTLAVKHKEKIRNSQISAYLFKSHGSENQDPACQCLKPLRLEGKKRI